MGDGLLSWYVCCCGSAVNEEGYQAGVESLSVNVVFFVANSAIMRLNHDQSLSF